VKQLSKHENLNVVRVRISLLIRRNDGKLCFARHKKAGREYWLLPGGGQEASETAKEAADRELEEELNLKANDYRFLFARESINPDTGRHILFMFFEAIEPDFSNLRTGTDPRVAGFDFFDFTEFKNRPIYPAITNDLDNFINNRPIELFRTLEWIP
jgi:ADP-ribose pyrophosphatase YjhB (NUDIX family)